MGGGRESWRSDCQIGNGNANGNREMSSVMGMAMGDCEWGSPGNLSVSPLSLSLFLFISLLLATRIFY